MEYNEDRVEVTGITINLSYPDGKQKTLTIDPKRAEALFWSDRAIKEIFAPFYDKIERYTTGEELTTRFGDHIDKLLPKDRNEKFLLTSKFIDEIWYEKNKFGLKMPFMCKTVKCIPTCWDHY